MKVKKVVVEDFGDFWEEIKDLAISERGKVDYISVGSIEELNRILTPQRKKLLDVIKKERPSSLKKLAELVGRDYKNVYKDITLLERMGFLKLERRGKRLIPVVDYDIIDVQLRVGSATEKF